jgi:pimeloyl-ACP methyl ester carboxylesterase
MNQQYYSLKSGKGSLAIEYQVVDAAAPTIIFLHDSLGCIRLWRDFPTLLAKRAQCNYLVYDRLGYGISSENKDLLHRDLDYMEQAAAILIELIDAFAIKKPILFGHSDGASIALIAAAKTPSKIKGVISQAAHVFVEEISLNGIRAAKESYENANLKSRLMKYHGEKVAAVFYAWVDTWLSEKFRDWNIERFLPQIICPILVIQGKNDEFGSMEQVNSIAEKVSGNCDVLLIENVGHSPHKEAMEEVLKGSVAFILSSSFPFVQHLPGA